MPQTEGWIESRETTSSGWRWVYLAAAVAALLAVVIFRRNSGAEMHALGGFGLFFGMFDVPATHPASALEWFGLLQSNKLVGLVMFAAIDVINYMLVALIFVALYGALHRANRSAMTVALSSALLGAGIYVASNQAFAMLALSGQHAAASTEARRAMYEAAGEALLAIHNPGTIYHGAGIHIGLFLVLLGGLIASIVMLRSRPFGQATAIVGLLANGICILFVVTLALGPRWMALPVAGSAPFRVAWYVLIAIGLLRLRAGKIRKGVEKDGA